MGDLMTIGQLADATHTTATTLRYYDDIGLVRPAGRVGGQRRYSRQAVRRLHVIDRFQQAGFTLEEIRRLLDGGGDWQELAREKRTELERRIADLQEAVHFVNEALACGCEHLEGCDRTRHLAAAP